ncbi:GNAT family N-acetyltransferase [Devosia epidermidihirudinis]|uniref:GNAT family N-acetyltransferase n=1 Tax=Devosia epidermidihirudinis TaxID=1293439 RepID=UPI0006989C24|nr:GNAT family N-acetyltransferase [Devosia epidermidihirudinis]
MPITIKPAQPSDRSSIANLIQLYLYDMTEFMPFPVGADGRYEYDFLDRFWRFPYLIYEGEEIAGFAFVIDECPLTGRSNCYFMAEFFILTAYRGRGFGSAALRAILANHHGEWHLGVPIQNTAALAFWQKSLAPISEQWRDLVFEGDRWRLNAFTI